MGDAALEAVTEGEAEFGGVCFLAADGFGDGGAGEGGRGCLLHFLLS